MGASKQISRTQYKIGFGWCVTGCIVSTLILALCALIVAIYDHDIGLLDGLRALGRNSDLPASQVRYNQVLGEISKSTNDVLLKETVVESLHATGSLYPGCIRAATDRIYGANRAFAAILADFEQKLSTQDGWQQKANKLAYVSATRGRIKE
jgi:hypothetical protein